MKELLELPEFPVRGMPAFDRVAWRLTVDGLVLSALSLNYNEVLAFPGACQISPFSCLEGWRVADNLWEGVAVRTLLEAAGPLRDARFVVFHAGSFFVSLSLTIAMKPTTLLAYRLDGCPLPPEHGFPLRLVVPDKQCYYGVKWVQRLELSRRARQSGKTIALGRVWGRTQPERVVA